MKFLKDFAFGAVYLISGIYSLGLSFVMTGMTQPLSGRTAYIPVPDALFPVEVVTFMLFGALFLVASLYHFRITYQTVSVGRVRLVRSESSAT